MQSGPFVGFVGYAKEVDNSYSAVSSGSWYWRKKLNATRTDRDLDSYRIAGIYNFKGGETGLLFLGTVTRARGAGSLLREEVYDVESHEAGVPT